jgi:hypothetical protein
MQGNEKEGLTVIAAITVVRTEFPLSLIEARKTRAVEQTRFGDIGYHRACHSRLGWTTSEAFCRWFAWLRGVHGDGLRLWVVLDCYSLHNQQAVKDSAAELGIRLLFIPPGLTDELQPLNRFVLGVRR